MNKIDSFLQPFLTAIALQQQLDEARKSGDTAKVEQLEALLFKSPKKKVVVQKSKKKRGTVYYFTSSGIPSLTPSEDTIFEVEALNEANAIRKFNNFIAK